MADHDNIDPAPAPTPSKGPGAQWLGRPIVKPEHAADLEREAAINEFHLKMPRAEAEEHAHLSYQKRLREEAAAHHLAGMRGAHAAGDLESARKHAMMYELHSKALGHNHVGPAHPSVVALMESKPFKARFKPHHGDVFAVGEHADKARNFDDKPLNAEGEDPSGKANADAKHHPFGKALSTLHAACEVLAKGDVVQFPGNPKPPVDRGAEASITDLGTPHQIRYDHHLQPGWKEKGWGIHVETAPEMGAKRYHKPIARLTRKGVNVAQAWALPNDDYHVDTGSYRLPEHVRMSLTNALGEHYQNHPTHEFGKAERKAKAKVVPCRCDAYHHPHRAGGGKCGAK